jgi:outer membrane protein assembly factor BamB
VTKYLRIAGLALATLLVTGCGLFGDDEEELEPAELVDFDEAINVKRLWSAKLGGESDFLRVGLRPAGDGARIYAASRDGKVTAFDPETGRRVWRADLDVELSAGPGVGEGHVVVAAKDGFAIVLDATDGSEKWRADIAGESVSRPLVEDDTVIVQTIDNRLQALSLFDGRPRWSIQRDAPALTMRGSANPVAVANTVIAGFDSGRLIAAEIESGTVVWDVLLSPPQGRSDLDRLSDVDGALAVVGQDIYATGYHGRLAALAAESGQVLWSRDISSYKGVAADWNSLYTIRDEGEIIALVRGNGDEAWRNNSMLRREPTLPIPLGTTIVVGDLEGYIHFFNAIDGAAVARERLGGKAITSDPFVMANRVYVQSDSGQIGAYVIVDDRPKRSQPDVAEEE